MSQTTLAIPKQQNSFKQVKPKTIVGKGENHYVQQEQQQAQHPRGQGRYEQVQDGSRQRPACTSTILKITEKILLKLLKIDKLTHKKGYTVRLKHGVSLFYVGVYMKQNSTDHDLIRVPCYYSSGRYSMMSFSVQFKILQRASNVFVDTDSLAFNRRMVELLISPLTCNVYVVAPRSFMVLQSGS